MCEKDKLFKVSQNEDHRQHNMFRQQMAHFDIKVLFNEHIACLFINSLHKEVYNMLVTIYCI